MTSCYRIFYCCDAVIAMWLLLFDLCILLHKTHMHGEHEKYKDVISVVAVVVAVSLVLHLACTSLSASSLSCRGFP